MWAAGAAAVGSIFGGWLSSRGASDANRINRYIADSANQTNVGISREQMAFQERMSSTAYQRARDDMLKAGINPILAYQQGGSSTPSGAGIPAVTGAAQQNELEGAGSSARSVGKHAAEMLILRENLDKIRSDTELNKAQTKLANRNAQLSANNAKVAATNDKLLTSKIAGAEAEEAIDKTTFGNVLRYIGRVSPIFSSAKSLFAPFLRSPDRTVHHIHTHE